MEDIKKQIEAALQENNLKAEKIEFFPCPYSGHDYYPVARVKLSDGRTIIAKTEKDVSRDSEIIQREAQIIQYLFKNNLPVPEVIGISNNVILMTELPGETLFDLGKGEKYSSNDLTPEMFAQIGQFQARLHKLPIPEFLKDENTDTNFYDDMVRIFHERITGHEMSEHFQPEQLKKIDRICVEKMKDFPHSTDKSLIHMDSTPGNYLFQGGQLSGAIDFGRSRVIHPFAEIITVYEFRLNPYEEKLRDALLKAYREEFGEGESTKYINPETFSAHRLFRAVGAAIYATNNNDKDYLRQNLSIIRQILYAPQ